MCEINIKTDDTAIFDLFEKTGRQQTVVFTVARGAAISLYSIDKKLINNLGFHRLI